MAGSHEANGNNCRKSRGRDTDEMVQCDVCDQWYHFGCVGVNSEVADVSWSCEYCKRAASLTIAGHATHTTTPTNANAKVPRSSTELQGINQQVYITTPSTSVGPVQEAPSSECLRNILPPLHLTTAIAPPQPAFPSTIPLPMIYSAPIMSYIPSSSWQNTYPTIPAHIPPNYFHPGTSSSPIQSQTTYAVQNRSLDDIARQRNLELKRLEEEMQFKRRYLDEKYKILAQTNESSTPYLQMPMSSTGPTVEATVNIGPTPTQLAARQSFSKQLPTFNGDPDEWPLFISSFENSTSLAGYTDAENLIRLQSSLKGKAREIVKNKLIVPQMVPEIIRTLRMCFGRPEHILERAISKTKSFPPIKDKLDTLIEFAMCVRNICATMEACQMHSHLNNPILVKELVDKLPNNHKLTWAMLPKDSSVPSVKVFSDWLYSMAEAASSVTPLFGKVGASVNTHNREESNDNNNIKNKVSTSCLVCNNSSHKIVQCDVFKNMSLNRKWECVKTKNLCRQCLGRHRRKCDTNKECGIDGCKYKHNPLLHKKLSSEQNGNSSNRQNSEVNAHSNSYDESQPLFRILPVNIHSSNKIKKVYAFLDEGSAVTLIERSVFDEMGLRGESDPLCLRWTGDTTRQESDSVKADVTISSVTNNKKFQLKAVHTVNNLGLSAQTIDVNKMSKLFPYLTKLPIQSYQDATPVILIGANNWNLAIPLKIREGLWNQPIASKTRLGWTLQGSGSKNAREYRMNIHACDCQQKYNELHDMVREYFCVEACKAKQLLSYEDKRAMAILENTSKKINNQYEAGLLWRNPNECLPDSYNTALKRLQCLQNKFKKNPSLKTTIQTQINNLLLKGYAKKLTQKELEVHHDKTWYLPIFVVSNPNKLNKVRLVWDAAAKCNGVSLNDFIMSGPDLLKPLMEILLKFRIGKIAICGDISEMFHRIKVIESDMHAQRFLWYDENTNDAQPTVFVMRALTFGISCAPCIAHYIRDKNAGIFKDKYPRAVEAIQQNHYVDDFIDSAPDEVQAIELAMQVKEIHETGGFEMHNWTSNSEMVLKRLNNDNLPETKMQDWGSTAKILGLYWNPNNDEFRYICRFARLKRDVFNERITPTKRETLQVLMSIFDPLGFVSCYTIGLKIVIQDIWRSGMAWDEELTDDLNKTWCKWKSLISKITSIRIPRCYSSVMQTADDVQLHTFVDAGENAYAAVCYLRIKKNDVITVSLVAAKSKVAPLKPLSVPRLELQAALLGTRLSKKLLQVPQIKIDSQFWWSDSKTILKWLQMDPKRFHQFVMHRVGEILESSNVKQWKWVPSKQNPADIATKVQAASNAQMWFDGPEFLRSDPIAWPHCDDFGTLDTTEIKRCNMVIENTRTIKLNIEYFSNWRRLFRAVATFLLYCQRLRDLAKYKFFKEHIDVDCTTIEKAQMFLFKYAQNSEYSQEIHSLAQGKPIHKKSKLIYLNIYLDENGVLRSRGRTEFLNNHDDVIVLPTNHYVTFLLIRHFHEKFRHQCHETALNEIRSYYISKLRVLFRKVRRVCQWCKVNRVAPQIPQMAALPAARLAAFERPFTYVGVDYFGPINVSVGRRREKRWGVIFTCLTVRAVHIEIAHTLDTSSCIMAIRNFIARRGTPKEIYSDNGTNFKAAEKIMCSQLKNANRSTIKKAFDQIKWKFNPPAAPHMGGAWERLVRSVKTVVYSICPTMKFTDESLKNALCEAEFTINCRPLTFVSIENSDDEALTPNHLLIGSSDGYKPITNEGMDLRQRWYKTQEFAEQFWRRWLKEYIPIISRRSIWFTKQPPIKPGDVVVIVDPDLPRNTWPKGIVIDTVVAKDGQVRRATIKTKSGVLQRPVARLAILDVTGASESKLDLSTSFTEEGIVAPKSL